MNKVIIVAMAALMVSACSSNNSSLKVDTSSPTELATELDSVSYLLGINYAKGLKSNTGIEELDNKSFLTGMARSFQDMENEMPEDEANAFMQTYFTRLKEAKSSAALSEGEDFLAQNRTGEGVIETASGLQYKVITEGTGPIVGEGEQVKVHYTGKFINGKVFDSSVDRGEPAIMSPNGVIKGWTEALGMMKVGSKWELVIPSELGYGTRDKGPIPGNSVLIFEIELLDIVKPEPIQK